MAEQQFKPNDLKTRIKQVWRTIREGTNFENNEFGFKYYINMHKKQKMIQ